MARSTWLVSALAVLVPAMLDAQEVTLRFAPPAGMRVHVLWHFDVRTTLVEPDGRTTLSTAGTGSRSLTYRVLADTSAGTALEVTLDSVRFRWRPDGALWTTLADTGGPRPQAELLVDPRLRVAAARCSSADCASLPALRAFAGGFEAPLPQEPVGQAREWTAETVVPLSEPTGLDAEPGVGPWLARTEAMITRATFAVDSIVDRGSDTLAYIALRGTFLPAILAARPDTDGSRARVSGAVAGRLIWSTGWHTWVSGALRYTLQLQVLERTRGGERVAYTVNSEITSRLRVRQ